MSVTIVCSAAEMRVQEAMAGKMIRCPHSDAVTPPGPNQDPVKLRPRKTILLTLGTHPSVILLRVAASL